MALLISALSVGLILSLLAIGVFISFRIFSFPDITADGSITLGAAVAATLMVGGIHPLSATLAGTAAGAVAGAVTGILHTRFRIHGLLSGILVMTALYSVNLRIMGKSNLPLMSSRTLASTAESAALRLTGGRDTLKVWGWDVRTQDAAALAACLVITPLVCVGLYLFMRTNLGTAMRATGDNPQMIRALGVNVEGMIILGLAISNGCIALSGALLAQYQGFADVQMGIGMVVWGLASVILGEALIGTAGIGLTLMGVVMGTVLFRLLVATALRWGLDANDLKLVTAVFVFVALVLPGMLARAGRRLPRVSHA
jgi:putative tryptophan/tyrosine transport system permease protein